MERDEIIGIIKDFSGTVGKDGKWLGNELVTPLFIRLYRAAPDVLLELDEDGCKKKIIRGIKQLTRVTIPESYDPNFWASDRGRMVVNKLDKKLPRLPQLPKVRKGEK